MATAAQLRARANFARVMKSGGFPAKRKRAKNPVSRSGRSGGAFTAPIPNPRRRAAPRKKNPAKYFDSGYAGVGRSGRSGPDMSQHQSSNDPRGYRDMNPSRRGERKYHVVPASGKGPVAMCKTMPEAKKVAGILADSYGRAFGIITD